MDSDTLNAHLCDALGIPDFETIVDVVLEIKHSSLPIVTIRRVVLSAEGVKTARAMVGFTVETGHVNAVEFVSH